MIISYIVNFEQITHDNTITFLTIILGQIISVLFVTNKQIVYYLDTNHHFRLMSLVNSVYYAMLGFFWLIYNREIIRPKLMYMIIILFETQSTFCGILAKVKFNFEHLYIIPCISFLLVSLSTDIFLKKYKYSYWHIGSKVLVLGGMCSVLYDSFIMNSFSLNTIKGNIEGFGFALISGTFLGISATIQEIYFESGQNVYDYLPWMGFIGALILFGESFLLSEVQEVIYIKRIELTIFYNLVGYILTQFVLGSITPFYIRKKTAIIYSSSLISQIFYKYLVDVLVFSIEYKGYFIYCGFGVLLIGLFIYSKITFKFTLKIPLSKNNTNDLDKDNSIEESWLENSTYIVFYETINNTKCNQ